MAGFPSHSTLRPTLSRQAGFSLIEMLITIIVLASGLLAIGTMYGSIMNASTVAKQQSLAAVLGEKKLEELRGTGYAGVTGGADTVTAASAGAGSTADYSRSWSVTTASAYSYKDVAITVSWTDSKNNTASIGLSTRISNVTTTAVTIP